MPTVEEALQIGWKQHQSGNVRGAEDIYRQVLAVAPGNENAWCFLGMACHDQARFDEAAMAYREALRIKPNFPVALSNFGNTLKQQGKLAEAEASCREALRYKPDYSTAYNNLGVVLVAQGRLEAAAETFEKSLSLMPNDAVAQANLGAALVRQGRFNEGTEISQKALKINPNYAEAHKNLAIVWLLLGDFERGWPEYEWRWRCPGSALPDVVGSRWNGSPLAGRTLLLHWEQGLGDTVHFVRYARLLKRQGARIAVCCQKPLKKLMAWCEGIDELVAAGESLPAFDYWSPMLSVPGILNTTLEKIPAEVGYIRPDPVLVEKWKARLKDIPGFRIGITWQGSPDFHADKQRSIPLQQFERLARIPGVRLISLQKGFGTEQLADVRGKFDVVDFGSELDESTGPFLDTAALMHCLDLIVSSDTCVPHLSAAMGLPTWVGLSVSPDWRWLLKRDDSPWYPTMKLFRQSMLGDWEGVFERIAAAVMEKMSEHSAVVQPSSSVGSESFSKSPILVVGTNELIHTRHGVMLCDPTHSEVGRALKQSGEFRPHEIALLCGLLSDGDVVIDAAGHWGEYVIPLAKHIGERGVVYAFEPDRIDFQTLCANVALNGLTNACGRWELLGEAKSDADQQSRIAAMNTIDALGLRACHLLKLESPGHEIQILAGAKNTIQRLMPAIYLRRPQHSNQREIGTWLKSVGYQLFWHAAQESDGDGRKEPNLLAVRSGVKLDVSGLTPGTPDSV